jgi:hypothetical protein
MGISNWGHGQLSDTIDVLGDSVELSHQPEADPVGFELTLKYTTFFCFKHLNIYPFATQCLKSVMYCFHISSQQRTHNRFHAE